MLKSVSQVGDVTQVGEAGLIGQERTPQPLPASVPFYRVWFSLLPWSPIEAQRGDEATALRTSICESSPIAKVRASSSGGEPGSTVMSIKVPWVWLQPWMRLGLGPGDTFSLHYSLGRSPPQHLWAPSPRLAQQ